MRRYSGGDREIPIIKMTATEQKGIEDLVSAIEEKLARKKNLK
jgi:hypothetical protein